MSENTKDKQTSDEIDLVIFFSLIGKLFSRIYNFFSSILKSILSFFVFLLKALIDNIKLISIVLIVSAIVGYGLEKTTAEVYRSSMYVKPYFDSKYQLVNNINYFNALISNRNHKTLSDVFEIPVEDAKKIREFEIHIGPESENDKIKQYDSYLKSLDSIRAQDISYDDFIENRDIYSSDFYEITVQAEKKDIFKSLEEGLNSSFENTYSEKKMKKRDSLIYLQKQSILASIRAVDSLQDVYIKVLEENSKSSSNSISLGEGFSIEPEKAKTREFELLNKELQLRSELRVLEERKVEEDVFFDTVSGFQEIGSISRSILNKYVIILPALSLIFLCFIFVVRKTVTFVKNYEE